MNGPRNCAAASFHVKKPTMSDTLPLLALTMGDPAGTGPELLTKALALPELRAIGRPLVIGDAAILEQALTCTGVAMKVRAVAQPEDAAFATDTIDVLDLKKMDLAKFRLGTVDPMAGNAAYEYVKTATELALAGIASARSSPPLSTRQRSTRAGHHFDGHTGLLAELCQAPGATMMLVADKLRVSHVSTHVSLAPGARSRAAGAHPQSSAAHPRRRAPPRHRVAEARRRRPESARRRKRPLRRRRREIHRPGDRAGTARSGLDASAVRIRATPFFSARCRASSTARSRCITTRATSPPRCSASGAA